MRIRNIIFGLAASALLGQAVTAQDAAGSVTVPEKRVIETGASPALSLEETTAAISVISNNQIGHRSSKNIGNSILGQGLGLISLQKSGTYADQNPTFYVRGLQTLNGNDAPLVLVDGIERDIASVSAEEVDYVVILKDAPAVALYGYKGINGAIQIVTKRGEYNTRTVKFTYDHRFNSLTDKPQFVDAYTYGMAINEARRNDGLEERYLPNELEAFRTGKYPTLYPNVNWVDETFRNTASTDNLNVEFSGGEGRFRYFAMMNLLSDRGFIRNSEVNDGYSTQDKYVRGNLRLNMDIDLTPTTLVKVSVLGMLMETNSPGSDVNVWDMVYSVPSAAFPVRDDDGMWAGSDMWAGTKNPVAQTTGAAYYKNHNRLLFADVSIKQDLSDWTEGLGAFVRLGYDNIANIYEDHSKTYMYSVSVPNWEEGEVVPSGKKKYYGKDSAMGTKAGTNSYMLRSHIELGSNYEKSFGQHSVVAQMKWDYEYFDKNGINNTLYRHNLSMWVHYGYSGKYFVDLAAVESGSNRLAPGTKWNPSATLSFAWLISKEDFLSGADWIDFLKLRVSAGLLSTDFLPDGNWTYYAQQYGMSDDMYPFGSGFDSDFGTTSPKRYATENPGHEVAYKYNVGLDSRIFGGLGLTLDAYYQRRSGIWVDASGKNTSVVGIGAPYENGGIVDSWGTELGIDYCTRIGEVDFNIGGNFNFNRSKVVEMLEEPKLYPNLVRTGDPVGQTYGLKAIGYFRDDADVASSLPQTFSVVRPGDIKYEDVNGDGRIDENDVVPIGFSTKIPEIFFNFNIGAEWKGLGFYALFQGAGNYSAVLNTKSMYFPLVGNTTISQYYYDNRWTDASSTDARFPRLSSESNDNNYRTNTLFLVDRSFVKLRNVEVYYNLPERLLSQTKFVKGAKLYVQGNDLFSLDYLDVSDPEAYGTTPLFRSLVLGLSLTF